MEALALGRSGVRVAPVVVGTMSRSGGSREERLELFERAFDAGLRTFDTAPLYDFGEADTILGELLRSRRREEVVLASKVGLRWTDDFGDILFEAVDTSGTRRVVRRDSRPSAIRADVEESLARLGVERLDLVQIHHPDPHTPIEASIEALLTLRAQGKVGAIGISNFDQDQTERASRAMGGTPLANLQVRHNLIQRELEQGVLGWAAREEVGVLTYSPLAEGLLAGKYRDRRPSLLAREPLHHPANATLISQQVRSVVEPIAQRRGVPLAAVALAWSRSVPAVTAPVVGVTKAEHVDAAVAATTLELEPEERDALERAFATLPLDLRAGRRRRDRLIRAPTAAMTRARGVLGRVKRRVLG